MIVKDFYIRNDQWRFLRDLPGTAAEHVRAALDDYMAKKESQKLKVSTSKSYAKAAERRAPEDQGPANSTY